MVLDKQECYSSQRKLQISDVRKFQIYRKKYKHYSVFNCKPLTEWGQLSFIACLFMYNHKNAKTHSQIITAFFSLSFFLQLSGPSLLHIWHTVWLWLLLCLPAHIGHPWPLLPPAPGPGQWRGDGRRQPLFHGPPDSPQQGGGTSRP